MTDQTETPAPGTAVAKPAPKLNLSAIGSTGPRGVLTFLPQTMEDCLTIAQLMAKSDFAVPPKFRGNPGACLAVAIQAARWGADPFAVIQKAYVTKSKGGDERLAYEAQLVAAVVNTQAPLVGRLALTYSGQGASRKVKCVGVFRDTGEVRDVETPPISQINPKNSPLWVSDPDQQLGYYVMRSWGRRWVPEVLMGIYTPEELQVVEATDAPRPERPNGQLQVTDGPNADETGIEPFAEPEPAVDVVVEEEPVPVPGLEVSAEEVRAVDELRPTGDDQEMEEGVIEPLPAEPEPVDEADAEHQTAVDSWEAYLTRAIDGLMDPELSTEAQLDDYATRTKAALMAADGLSEDERDDLRARFVSKYLNAKRDRGFARKAR